MSPPRRLIVTDRDSHTQCHRKSFSHRESYILKSIRVSRESPSRTRHDVVFPSPTSPNRPHSLSSKSIPILGSYLAVVCLTNSSLKTSPNKKLYPRLISDRALPKLRHYNSSQRRQALRAHIFVALGRSENRSICQGTRTYCRISTSNTKSTFRVSVG